MGFWNKKNVKVDQSNAKIGIENADGIVAHTIAGTITNGGAKPKSSPRSSSDTIDSGIDIAVVSASDYGIDPDFLDDLDDLF